MSDENDLQKQYGKANHTVGSVKMLSSTNFPEKIRINGSVRTIYTQLPDGTILEESITDLGGGEYDFSKQKISLLTNWSAI